MLFCFIFDLKIMAYLHCPTLNVQNALFRLMLHRQLERDYPLVIRSFERRVDPWIIRLRNFIKRIWKKVRDFFLYY